jgi:hypothetical protein
LSDDAVIELISAHCVPVALNLYRIRDAQGAGGDFFRSVRAQKVQYQGLWVVAPDGRVLSAPTADVTPSGLTKQVLAGLQAGLKAFGPIAPRHVRPTNPLPYRGIGVQPDGRVTLAVADRMIFVKDLSQKLHPSQIGALYLGSVTLSAADWSTLAAPDARAGSRWTIPEAVGRRFFPILNVLDVWFGDPGEVTEVQLAGRVASVRDGIADLIYAGHIEGTHQMTKSEGREGRLVSTRMKLISGVGTYDLRAGQMLSLTWVWDGLYGNLHDSSSPGGAMRFGAVVEWRREDSNAPGPERDVELADSTPEDALKTFLLALAAGDAAALRAVALPDAELDWLLQGPPASPELLARLKARLEEQPMKRLRAGDPVTMPGGESRVIQPADVREGRVVLWPAGAPLPSRVENVGGHWKVLARPFIAARKQAEASRKPALPQGQGRETIGAGSPRERSSVPGGR